MRSAILLPTEYKQERNKIIDTFTNWKKVLDEYHQNYIVKDSESRGLWIKTIDNMLTNLALNKTSVYCLLLFNAKNIVQGIAFCGESENKYLVTEEKRKLKFHLFDFIIAPWNVKATFFTSDNVILKNTYDHIDKQLIKLILYYCNINYYSDLIYEPDWNTDKIHALFTKLQFKHSYRELGNTRIYINGYILNVSELKKMPYSNQFNVIFFNGVRQTKVFSDYPSTQTQDNEYQKILNFKLN